MSRPPRILHVEDNPHNRRLVHRILEAAGWTVLEAASGLVAMERLAEDPLPDLVLLDLALPGLDGYHVAGRIRADPRLAGLPVVALTAHAMPGDREKAIDAGCDDYLTKPIDAATLVSSLIPWLPEPLRGTAGSRPVAPGPSGSPPPPEGLPAALRQAIDALAATGPDRSDACRPALSGLRDLLARWRSGM